jgi:glycosyltransferase involved in cell wall biosynthesis
MRFSICIPSIRSTTLGQSITSILKQDFEDWELVVVGQGDEATQRAVVEEAAQGDVRVRYVHLQRRGASVARNAGVEASSGEIVAFMDDDCEAAPDWLTELDKQFVEGVGFVSGSLIAPEKTERLGACPHAVPEALSFSGDPKTVPLPDGFLMLGANIAARRSAFVDVHGFDDYLGPGAQFQGGEEHDLVRRMLRHGATVRSTPTAIVYHTYGWRYGVRAVYAYRRERIRGDGGLSGKEQMLRDPEGGLLIRSCMWEVAKSQSTTLTLRRLPMGLFRLFHLLKSYRECLRGYALMLPAGADPATATLTPRTEGRRSHTAAAVQFEVPRTR